jgi:predicted glycoside hydrolase/deacetylase ChbG (UPF0249 family)
MVMRAEAEGIRLIVRGDDLGMTQGSLVAFERAFNKGVLTCGSIIVCAPWFEAAATLSRNNPGWCPGVHLSLVGEWRGYRWRPAVPWDRVPSITDEDGFLFGYPGELWARKPKIEEIEKELRAQINLALKKGIRVQYLDTHYMGPSSYPGLEGVIRKLTKEYDLPFSGWMGEKRLRGIYTTGVKEKKIAALKMLEELTPGLWLWVCHPGIDSPEHEFLIHTDPKDVFTGGGVAKHRAEETNVLTSPEIKTAILEKGIKLTNYKDLWLEIGKHEK